MAPDTKKHAANCWTKGNEALERENWDYAIEQYTTAVKFDPETSVYRASLRGSQCRKYNNNKKGASLAGIRTKSMRIKIKGLRRKEDWKGVDALAEEGLRLNPWDAGLNADMAEACNMLGFKQAAIFGYVTAIENDRDNVDLHRRLAYLYEERGEYSDAITHWKVICRLNPHDSEARSKITQVEASAVVDRGGYEKADTTLDVRTGYDFDGPSASDRSSDGDSPGDSIEADLQHAIRKDPAELDNYIKLGEWYRRSNRLDEAAEMFDQALQVSGGDINVREQLEDVELLILRRNWRLAKEKAAEHPDDEEARPQAAAIGSELLNREIEVKSSRVDRHPNDNRLKYELAMCYMQVAKWDQSIPLLQQASADTRIEANVAVALGRCFLKVKKTDLARRQYEKAIKEMSAVEKPDEFKVIHYQLGRIYEEAGEVEKAENHYNEVLSVDYEYRDTLERLERLQAGGGS